MLKIHIAVCNLYAKYAKILEICKHFSENLVNAVGNVPRRGVVPRFSDVEVVALSMTAEDIDSENLLFNRLKEFGGLMPNLICKVGAFTVLRYINSVNGRPVSRVKYALNP